jgi:hypothetical protein
LPEHQQLLYSHGTLGLRSDRTIAAPGDCMIALLRDLIADFHLTALFVDDRSLAGWVLNGVDD